MPIPKKRHPDRRAPVTDRFFCPCPRGLEPALAAEFDEFGFRDIEETPGGGATFHVAFPLAAPRDAAEHLLIETQPLERLVLPAD